LRCKVSGKRAGRLIILRLGTTALTILTFGRSGALGNAQRLMLPLNKAAVLFAVLLGVAPVSLPSAAGVCRNLQFALLGRHGLAPSRAGTAVFRLLWASGHSRLIAWSSGVVTKPASARLPAPQHLRYPHKA
jgi:hypothetical protein